MLLFCITQQVASQLAIKNDVDSVIILYLDWNAMSDANRPPQAIYGEGDAITSFSKFREDVQYDANFTYGNHA